MNAFAFRHLPELCGKIVPAEASRLRATDEVLASWDEQALALGLGTRWRCSDEWLEVSRRALLSGLDRRQDLWIFAYGSLMWDPALHFTELRRARLSAYQRRFSYLTTIGRGNAEQAGLVLSLEAQPGHCEGLAFRIDASIAEQESRLFWRREMIVGGYQPRLLPLSTPQGELLALTLVSNPGHASHAGGLSLAQEAAIIRRAQGSHGTNRDYLEQLVDQLDRLGIVDGYVQQLSGLVTGPDFPLSAPGRSNYF